MFIIINSQATFSQNTLQLSLSTKDSTNSILRVNFILTANPDTLKVPDRTHLKVGYINDSRSDCFFEIQHYYNNLDSALLPIADYDYFSIISNSYTYILPNYSYTYNFDLGHFYQFIIGQHYKIRACYRLTKYSGSTDVYSNWLDINY